MERSMNGMAGSPPESVVEGVERAAAVGPPGPISPDDPRPGETWRHYEGRDYEIVAVGLFEDDRTPMVVYRCPKSGQGWVRTLANFTEVVVTEGIAGRPVPYRRFSRVGRPKDDGTRIFPEDPAWDRLARISDILDAAGIHTIGTTDDRVAELARRYREAVSQSQHGKPRPDDRTPPNVLGSVAMLLQTAGYHVDVDRSIYDCVEELIGRVRANDVVSQHGKPPVPVPIDRMREAWMALQLVIARLDTLYILSTESVLLKILEGADDVKRHLDAAMGEGVDEAEIAPGEAPH